MDIIGISENTLNLKPERSKFQETENEDIPTFKVVLVGDKKVGKSSFLRFMFN
jgi:GTPase SAR1 family protein